MQSLNSENAAPVKLRSLRVVADRNLCCGYGVCAEICPEVFAVDEAGVVKLLLDVVPANLEARAREGAAACPQCALEVKEE